MTAELLRSRNKDRAQQRMHSAGRKLYLILKAIAGSNIEAGLWNKPCECHTYNNNNQGQLCREAAHQLYSTPKLL